jgi:rhamnose transport system permease protein
LKNDYKKWLRHEAVLLILLGALLIYAQVTEPDFLIPSTQIKLLDNLWQLAILAVPMTLIILAGGIDLSVGSIMALCAVVIGLTFERGISPFVGALLALLCGLAAGALNGWFVARVRVHPLLVTLATLAAFRGVAEGISQARPISGFPENFRHFFGGMTPPLCFAVAAVAAIYFLNHRPGGVWLRAIGHNETGARFSALPVESLKLKLYAWSGLAASVAAIAYVARRNTAKADIGTGIELDAITAVVLGGTSIFGGRGHVWGTLLGLLLIHETREFVSWHWSRNELNLVVLGVLLILSVLLHRLSGEEK